MTDKKSDTVDPVKALLRYSDAGAMLASSLENDIKAGTKITSGTVLALSRFVAADKELAKVLLALDITVDFAKLN